MRCHCSQKPLPQFQKKQLVSLVLFSQREIAIFSYEMTWELSTLMNCFLDSILTVVRMQKLHGD